MDESVVRAMAKWPNVPAVYGWLSLDRRGQWRLQGGTIGNVGLREFISRNYLRLDSGEYAFQNGPQRVFVELEYTPWVVALDGAGVLRLHTGAPVESVDAAWMDEDGALLLSFDGTVALVDDRDAERVTADLCDGAGTTLDDDAQADAIDRLLAGAESEVSMRLNGQQLPLKLIQSAEVPTRFSFCSSPVAPA